MSRFRSVLSKDKREERCIYCGFVLDIQQTRPPRISTEKGYALIADDSKYTRKRITEILQEKNYSGHIELFENGAGIVKSE